jgi:hypothetical protein
VTISTLILSFFAQVLQVALFFRDFYLTSYIFLSFSRSPYLAHVILLDLAILIIFVEEYKFLKLAEICSDNDKIIFRDLMRCPDVDCLW